MECNIKTIFLGDMGVGKTTFMECFVAQFDQKKVSGATHASTICVDFKRASFSLEDIMYKVTLWDTAGQERFRSITRQFYRGSDIAFVLVSLPDLIASITEKANAGATALKGAVHVQPNDSNLSDYDIVKRALQPYYTGVAQDCTSACTVFTILNKIDLVDRAINFESLLLNINKVIGENVAELPQMRSPMQISCRTFEGMKRLEVEFTRALQYYGKDEKHTRKVQQQLTEPAPQQQGCSC
jgi:GTPase SAR1 family protein